MACAGCVGKHPTHPAPAVDYRSNQCGDDAAAPARGLPSAHPTRGKPEGRHALAGVTSPAGSGVRKRPQRRQGYTPADSVPSVRTAAAPKGGPRRLRVREQPSQTRASSAPPLFISLQAPDCTSPLIPSPLPPSTIQIRDSDSRTRAAPCLWAGFTSSHLLLSLARVKKLLACLEDGAPNGMQEASSLEGGAAGQ